jgi:GNAT superfamily N-acetyltransferase
METIVYEEMKPGEEAAVCELVERVFNEFVAPDYGQEGVEEFFRFANPPAMAERIRSGGFVLLARQEEKLVGVLEFALPDRIAMLFVALRQHGIAKQLLARAIDKALSENPVLLKVTVHSSPYAEVAYRKMGFHRTANVKTVHGIKYIPMELPVDRT